MTAKALLINPSYLGTYGSNEGALISPVFPVLSLAMLAGAAAERGHDCRILDLSHQRYEPSAIRRAVEELRPDVVGITATTPLANQMRDISYVVKEVSPHIVTIGGGPHASALPEHTLGESALDLVVSGEADHVVADLLSGRDPGELPGVHTRSGGRPAPRRLSESLDDLPMPRWEAYPRSSARTVSPVVARHWPLTTIEFSRGCVYRCDFCASKNTMGFGYRKKSPERCAEEMVRLAHLGFREALVVDDIFTSDVEWASAVCEAIIRRDPRVAWTCSNGIRVDSGDSELYELMRRAGCYRVGFGFESGDPEVLRSFGKGGRASLDNARRSVRLCRDAGIEVNGYFMLGLSADDASTMRSTVSFARTLPLDAMKCGIAVPFPGTAMFHDLHQSGRIRSYDWDDYTVYSDPDQIFVHPRLEPGEVRRRFREFYLRNLVLSPRYLARRARAAIRHRELGSDLRTFIGLLRMGLNSRRSGVSHEYQHEAQWRRHDLGPATELSPPAPVRAARGSGVDGRDGLVVLRRSPGRVPT